MGYVHDVAMAQFVPPTAFGYSAGTWALAVATNVWSLDRSAGDAAFTVYMPVPIPSNSVALKGSKLLSIELMYSIGTGAADDFVAATCALYKDTLQATAASGSGTLNTAAIATGTLDTGHDTAAELKAVDEHRLKWTLTTPAWIDNDEAYHFEAVVDAAADTVFKIFGGIINYTLRL
jgi:hypothetical protein